MTDPRSPEPAPIRPENARRIVASSDLLQGRKEVLISHGSEVYRLLLTRSGKLILQK